MAHVAEYKKNIVNNIVKLVKEYPIVGAVNMEDLPTPQLQVMRAQLRDKVVLIMAKRRLMKIALEKAENDKKDIEKLEEYLKGMPALIFTKDSPFKLSKILQKNKSSAPAKAGQIAPKDIVVNKGSTGFAPGPIISELGMIGIKAGVEAGKVAVKGDTVVVKEGEQIKPKVAEILTRLGIKPMEVGLDLMAAYEDGLIYTKDILTIDDQEYMNRLNNATRNAFNLAFNIEYTTKDNISFLIGKAFNDAKALGLSQEILDKGIVEELLAKAERFMLSLKETASIEVEEKAGVKEEKIEEKKPETEEKKEIPEEITKEEPKKEEKEPQKEKEAKEKVSEKGVSQEKVTEEKPQMKVEEKEVKVEEKVKEPIKEVVEQEKPKQGVKEVVKEEIKPEKEPIKQEVKEPETKKEELPKAEEKPEIKTEAKKETKEEKFDTDKKIEEMVKRTKEFMEGKQVTAGDIVKEVEKEVKVEEKLHEEKEVEKEEVPSAYELEKKKKEEEQKEIEELAKELVKKGTLRK